MQLTLKTLCRLTPLKTKRKGKWFINNYCSNQCNLLYRISQYQERHTDSRHIKILSISCSQVQHGVTNQSNMIYTKYFYQYVCIITAGYRWTPQIKWHKTGSGKMLQTQWACPLLSPHLTGYLLTLMMKPSSQFWIKAHKCSQYSHGQSALLSFYNREGKSNTDINIHINSVLVSS